MATPSYINARGTILALSSSPTAVSHRFWAANPGQTTSAPGGGHILYGDQVDDTFYIYMATDQVIVPAVHGDDTVNDGAWNATYTLAAGVQNLILSGGGQVGIGNAMDNLIIAESGTDTMIAGTGDDVFVDGTGSDTIILPFGGGSDVIYGFKNGADHVSLQGSALTSFAAVTAAMTQTGANVVLNLGGGQTLTFNNTRISAFVPGDFLLPWPTSGLRMTFDDEFNTFSASANGVGTTWRTTYAAGERTLSGNHEAEYYSDSSVGTNPFSDVNGILTITADPANPASNPAGLPYTSGLITTENSFSQLYGYFQMSAELPAGQGFWPAFWLLPANGAWPPELDVMEQIGSQPTTDFVTAHTDIGGFNKTIGYSVNVANTSVGFHTYGVYWGPDVIRWYFDGQEIASCATPADMNTPMYMLVNLAVGGAGSWPGTPATGATAQMLVDYVRAYAYTGSDPGITGFPTATPAYVAATARPSATTLNFGLVHVGSKAAQTLTITNGASGAYTDYLLGGFGAITAPFAGSGSLGAGLTGEASGSLSVTLSTAGAGVFTGSASLALIDNDPATGNTELATAPITLTGTVVNYASAFLEALTTTGSLSRSGNALAINLGTIVAGTTGSIDLAVLNDAAGPADLLSGSFVVSGSSGFINSGLAAFSGLASGQSDTSPVISLSSNTAGTFTETITLDPTGSNASGYSGALALEVVTVTGTVAPATVVLAAANSVVRGGVGGETIIAGSGSVLPGDVIEPAGRGNTLALLGGGVFNLNAVAGLANIQTVTAREGTGAAVPTVDLPNGYNLTMNVLPVAGGAPGAIIIVAGANADTINLGGGADTVYVGSSSQTVNGNGHDTIYCPTGAMGAAINGGGAGSELIVTTSGFVSLGGQDTNFGAIALSPASGTVTLFANAAPGLRIIGGARGGDTIQLGNASQSVIAGGPGEHIVATSAVAGAAVSGLGAGSELEISGGGTVTLSSATGGSGASDMLTVKLDQATHLSLSGKAFIVAVGGTGADTIVANAANQVLTGGGGQDTLVGYLGGGDIFRDTSADLNGATIINFMANDAIDLTDMAFGTANLTYRPSASTVTVTSGSHSASISLVGSFSASGFVLTGDGHGGTQIT